MAIDKAALLASRGIGTRTVTIPDVGEVIVRGLTRGEVLGIQNLGEVTPAVMEQKLLALALVDPKLTEDEIRTWQDNSPAGELQPVTTVVEEISGLRTTEIKERMRSFRE